MSDLLSCFSQRRNFTLCCKQEFKIIEEEYCSFYPIYTDGSKRNEKVACAFVTRNGSISYRLPDNVSIFTAEAKAVERALQYVKINPVSKKFILFTDSLSLIQTIENRTLKNPLIGAILRDINLIQEKRKQILFCWVPSHCGIAGNEQADKAAKEALNKPILQIDIPFTDKIPLVHDFLKKKWQEEWDEQINNKLYAIKPKIGPPYIVTSSRKDQVVLNRIRIGHSRLTHSYLMDGKPRPRCHFCNLNKILTVRHIVIKCSYFSAIRSNYFQAHNLKNLFDKVSPKDIIGFLKETSLYKQF